MRTDIAQLIQSLLTCEHDGPAKPLVDALVARLCDITGLELHPPLFMDTQASFTAQGKAVSPTTAAQCAEDVARVRVFLRGVHQAIHDKLAQTNNKPIQILYAGTGPFGLLLIPLLPGFKRGQLQVTLLDIHQESLDYLQHVIEHLDVRNFITNIHCVDALTWETQNHFDLLISETMKQGLIQEPQVSLFAHLQAFLAPDGWLLPELIRLDLWLGRSASRLPRIHLGTLFQLDRTTATRIGHGDTTCLSGELTLPEYPPACSDLILTTHIQVYGEHHLSENQSQLTLPIVEQDARPSPQSPLRFHYRLDSHPGIQWDYTRLPKIHTLPLPGSQHMGSLGIGHLPRMWHRAQQMKHASSNTEISTLDQSEWMLDKKLLDILGIGLEPAMQQLYSTQSLAEFEAWILSHHGDTLPADRIHEANRLFSVTLDQPVDTTPATLSVLSNEQWAFWHEWGYLIIPKVLNEEECAAARHAVWQFLGMKEDDPGSWYQPRVPLQKIMVQLFRHPALEVARTKLIIQQIFTELWQRQDLVMSTDRVSFNPPETNTWQFPGPHMHWDVELTPPIPFGTQGLIYLTDTTENQGAFQCVPGFHRQIDTWLTTREKNTPPGLQDWSRWPIKPIAANAGDLIIWHQALPHGSAPNRAQSPRIVQYLNMYH